MREREWSGGPGRQPAGTRARNPGSLSVSSESGRSPRENSAMQTAHRGPGWPSPSMAICTVRLLRRHPLRRACIQEGKCQERNTRAMTLSRIGETCRNVTKKKMPGAWGGGLPMVARPVLMMVA